MSALVQLTFEKVMQTRSYTVIVLGAREKRFAIYADTNTGKLLQVYLMGAPRPRPLTHDLISNIFTGFETRVKQIVISDLKETVYYARLFLEQQVGEILHIVEVDARPSDCITLAILEGAPIFCTEEVFENAVPVE